MSADELLTNLTRIFFVLVSSITLIDFLLRRDRVRRDVALAFLTIGATITLNIVMDLAQVQYQPLRRLSTIILVTQPFMLLRVVRYFRPVNKMIGRLALLGLIASELMLLTALDQPMLPPVVSLVIIVYFTVVDGYTIYAFVQGAMDSVGVVRNRLRLAATGSALLVAVLLVAGVRTLMPQLAPFAIPVTQLLTMLSALSYYLGFATPRWLRQAWQLVELRDFLWHMQSANRDRSDILSELVRAVNRAMTTDNIAILRADDAQKGLQIEDVCDMPTMQTISTEGAALRSLTQREPLVIYRGKADDPADNDFLNSLNVELMLLIPIATAERIYGVLAVCLEHGSLFIEDDIQLLTVLVRQTATLLENDTVVKTAQRYAQDLEKQVKQRTAALARSNQELRQFASVASHDLKEPLRTISSYLQLIEQRYADKLDDDGHEFIDFAVNGATRMKNLIDDLLIYSRVEREESNVRLVNMQDVLDEALRLLEISIEEAEASISQDPLPQIRADEHMMVQLIQNLLSNALKYRGERKPEIHIGVQQQNGEWLFSVRDNGIGIEEIYLDRIFIIFRRLHSQGEYSGTGIGLAVCKKAVEIHGGRIWAESEVGQGTTFYFTIPK